MNRDIELITSTRHFSDISEKNIFLQAIRSPLSRRLIVKVVLFSSIITLCTSGVQLFSTYKNELNNLDSLVEEIQYSRSMSLVESVWVYDENLLQIQLEGITRMPNIESVEILVEGKIKWSAGGLVSDDSRIYSFPLIKDHNGKKTNLGDLRVRGDMVAIVDHVKDAAFVVVISNAFKTLLVTLFFTWMFYYYVGKHLFKIADYTGKYSPGSGVEPLVLERKKQRNVDETDELSFVVNSMNGMINIIEEYRIVHGENERIAVEQAKNLAIANNELEEFAVRTSHDLRAPLVSSLSLLGIIKSSLEKGNLEKVGICVEHATNSLEILRDLLDSIAHLMLAKKSEEIEKWIDLSNLLDKSLSVISELDGFSDVEIKIEKSFQEKIYMKEICLQGVLGNLISNAIKYKNGSVKSFVKIEWWKKDGELVVQVSDNGLGIPPESENDVFKLFKRFHPNVAFGSGMGMYLMKISAGKMNGDLIYRRNEDGGSIFRLTVPLVHCDVHK